MIDEVEELMQHWGNQFNQIGDEGGLGSPMATIMEWGGCAPRSTPGSRDLMMASGGGMDHVAMEVAAALAQLERQSDKGALLAKLARNRYLPRPAWSVRSQLPLLGLGDDADRTYRNWVHALHQQVLVILTVRSAPRRARNMRVKSPATDLTRASTVARIRSC
ncbi:hypothetical protein GIW54_30580 [Pseudomonas proteolytica]|uniref:Uncharacterized protein n=1 Tax=Pseudomonas proteolytica TaxID=219574 RepID=A0AAW5A7X7_9PSED|nr:MULTISPECIES: hypothetical protein [Pseudomonas]MCF5056771.1 hypothetical protein [Pseudomonas proteolytica]MCF5105052.1 hypothetical protein [Pseudomonas proteolytica]MDD0981699.1 hypothetical protein [Pseudomonas shahriarae]